MALDINNYENALTYGALIQSKNLAAGSVNTAALGSLQVTGAKVAANTLASGKTTLAVYYASIAVPIQNTAVNVFGSATAPVAGTITGLLVCSAATAAGTVAIFGTTAGTMAVMTFGTGAGFVNGTGVLNASVAAGDTVTVQTYSGGSGTVFLTFTSAA